MSRSPRLALGMLALALAGCSAITSFDRDKIVKGDAGDVPDGETPPEDDGGGGGMGGRTDGGVDGGGPEGCDLGWAGEPCMPCEAGQYCAGGEAAAVACREGEWDHDSNAGTPCVLQRDCSAGTFVSSKGSATADRECAPCASGRFSKAANSELCEGWMTCAVGEYVAAAGTTGTDQRCEPCPQGTFSDALNSGQCVPIGACAAGTKQTIPGQNGACTACLAGEYCAGADTLPQACTSGTWDHDSSPASPCIERTGCGPGMYVSADGTTTIDRACSSCASGTYSTGDNAASCKPWSNCGAGQYISASGGPSTDRACSDCGAGTYSTTANASACLPFGSCGAGTYVAAAGTVTSNRMCAPCPAGQFNTGSNAESCQPWAVCQPGTYVSMTGTASANQVCTPCGADTYSATTNAGRCSPRGACAAGSRQVAPGGPSTPPTCAACVAGQYCPGEDEAPVACGAATSTWDHDQNPASPCVAWASCSAGQFVSRAGTATTNRMCTTCTPGSFSTAANAASCMDWRTCPAGQFVSVAGTATSNRTCSECANGTFTAAADSSSCTTHSVCKAGTFVSQEPTKTRDRGCTACTSGRFSTTDNAAMCTAWQTCDPGTYVSAAGTVSANRQCTACDMGEYSSMPNAAQCVPVNQCPAGTDQTVPATSTAPATCVPCVPGWYCPGRTTRGAACPTGTWDHDGSPASACYPWTECSAGDRVSPTAGGSTTADRQCVDCATGTFSSTTNATTCTAWKTCDGAVEYLSAEGTDHSDAVCSRHPDCDPGSHVLVAGTATTRRTCELCAAGSFSGGMNVMTCMPCPVGTAAATMGLTACTACGLNQQGEQTFAATTGSIACSAPMPCTAGQTLTTPASATHDNDCDCLPGYRVNGGTADHPMCLACTTGTFSSMVNAQDCTPHTPCATPGTWPSSTMDDTTCTAWSVCGNNTFVMTEGTTTTNRICADCPTGQTSMGPNALMCM